METFDLRPVLLAERADPGVLYALCKSIIAHGFNFLGYWFSPLGLAIARKTMERRAEKVFRRYEHGADVARIGTYLGRGRAVGIRVSSQ